MCLGNCFFKIVAAKPADIEKEPYFARNLKLKKKQYEKSIRNPGSFSCYGFLQQ
jgi:hypothetical protein